MSGYNPMRNIWVLRLHTRRDINIKESQIQWHGHKRNKISLLCDHVQHGRIGAIIHTAARIKNNSKFRLCVISRRESHPSILFAHKYF